MVVCFTCGAGIRVLVHGDVGVFLHAVWRRYGRFATRIGWDGATRDWAVAGGSGTGVLGLHIPSKGKVAGKKRAVPDPSKPPKAKAAKTSRSDVKKGHAGSRGDGDSPAVGANGEDWDVRRGQDGDANGKETESRAALGRNPAFPRKAGGKHPKKKNGANSAAAPSPPGAGGLDLNVEQPDTAVPDGKVSMNAGRGGVGVGTGGAGTGGAGAAASGQRMEKRSSMKSSQPGQAADSGTRSGPRGGSGHSGGTTPAGAGGGLKGGGGRKDGWSGREIDLNGSSDDDVTIVRVSAGSRFEADVFESAVAAPGRGSKTARDWTEGSETLGSSRRRLAERGESEGPSFAASRASGMGCGGAVDNEDSSLASHLMTRLAGSSAPDLLSLGGPEGLSQVQWPPAGGTWPVASLDEDVDFSRDLGSLSFPESGKEKVSGVGAHPLRISPPGRVTGRSVGRGGSSPSVARLQSKEGRTRGMGGSEQRRGETPAWMTLGTQQRRAPNSQGQGAAPSNHAGRTELSRPLLRLGPSSPVRPVTETGLSALHQAQSRAHSSPSRGGMAGLQGRPRAVGGHQGFQQAGAFPGVAVQSVASPESPVDTGLGLSLGSGGRQRQAGGRFVRDLQRQSPPR